MKLDPKVAKEIVKNLKEVVDYHINFIDTGGIIIASTKQSRIGTLHRGAVEVVKQKKTVMVYSDNEFFGARKGINTPIWFKDSIVAIIGITGSPEEVAPFGNILKKMTEILIRENTEQIIRFNKQMNQSMLVNLLRSSQKDVSMENYLFSILNLKRDIHRQVIIGKIIDFSRDMKQSEYDLVNSIINKQLLNFEGIFFSTACQDLCIIAENQSRNNLDELLHTIRKKIMKCLGMEFIFGVGKVVDKASELWKSAVEAEASVDYLFFSNTGMISYYIDFDIELVLINMSEGGTCTKNFLEKVFGNINYQEIKEFQEVFSIYAKNNGSITRCAESLFLHKNTVQNKLNKIQEKTGYNPRNLEDFVILYFAFRLKSICSQK